MGEVDLVLLVTEVFGERTPLMEKKGIVPLLKLPQQGPLFVRAHPMHTKTALAILIDNAIQYTPTGGRITVGVTPLSAREVAISVSDSGVGIPKEEQKNIFTKFFRASNALSEYPEGHGLGLAYAKLLVERQGRRIWFRSEAGKGAAFSFTLLTVR